jgi:hypothetical protein
LNDAERNYSISELELLAVIWAIRKFQPYIEYTRFVLETDHSAIMWLKRMKEPRGRLARWMLQLQGLDFEVVHRPGTSGVMKVPDALSRTEEACFVEESGSLSRDSIIKEQEVDPLLGKIITYLKQGREVVGPVEERVRLRAERAYLMDDGMLMRYVGPRGKPWEDEGLYWRIWLPQTFHNDVMARCHDEITSGHTGIRKTYLRLEQRFYWEGMHKDVVSYVSRCARCQEVKIRSIPHAPPSSYHPQGPWDLVFTDLMGPYPKTANQNTHLLVVVCGFTKFVELFPMRTPDAQKVTDRLWQVCCRWGVCKTIVADNGTQFTSGYFHEWCKARSIQPFHISAYHAYLARVTIPKTKPVPADETVEEGEKERPKPVPADETVEESEMERPTPIPAEPIIEESDDSSDAYDFSAEEYDDSDTDEMSTCDEIPLIGSFSA